MAYYCTLYYKLCTKMQFNALLRLIFGLSFHCGMVVLKKYLSVLFWLILINVQTMFFALVLLAY